MGERVDTSVSDELQAPHIALVLVNSSSSSSAATPGAAATAPEQPMEPAKQWMPPVGSPFYRENG